MTLLNISGDAFIALLLRYRLEKIKCNHMNVVKYLAGAIFSA